MSVIVMYVSWKVPGERCEIVTTPHRVVRKDRKKKGIARERVKEKEREFYKVKQNTKQKRKKKE